MKTLPSTSVRVAPRADSATTGKVTASGAATARSSRSTISRERGPGISVRSWIVRVVAISLEGSCENHPRNGAFRPDDPTVARGGPDRDRPVRPGAPPALERGRARRPLFPRLPQQPLPVHRRQAGAGGPDGARRGGRRAVRPPPGRVRPRLDARARAAPGRPRGAPGGQVEPGAARPADPLYGRLHRPRLGRARDARAVERRQPPDHDLPRDEDRPALVHEADRAGGEPVRLRWARLEVPGAEGPDAEPVLPQLRDGEEVKVLVTGGTGFVGSAVVHELRARGVEVRALVRAQRKAERLERWGVEPAYGDVTDADSVLAAARGCTHVVHLVAIIRGGRREFERVMVDGTRNVLAAARAAGVERFVHMSALGVSERTRILTPYFAAKWQMEQDVADSGVEHVVMRPSFVFGRDGGVLPTFVRQVRLSPVVTIIGSGRRRIQPV